MRRFFREIRIVEIQIANHIAIGERCPIWRNPLVRAKQRRSFGDREACRDSARGGAWGRVPRPESRTERVYHTLFNTIYDRGGQIFKSHPGSVGGHSFGEGLHLNRWAITPHQFVQTRGDLTKRTVHDSVDEFGKDIAVFFDHSGKTV